MTINHTINKDMSACKKSITEQIMTIPEQKRKLYRETNYCESRDQPFRILIMQADFSLCFGGDPSPNATLKPRCKILPITPGTRSQSC